MIVSTTLMTGFNTVESYLNVINLNGNAHPICCKNLICDNDSTGVNEFETKIIYRYNLMVTKERISKQAR